MGLRDSQSGAQTGAAQGMAVAGPWGAVIGGARGATQPLINKTPKWHRFLADPLGIFGGGGGPDTRAQNEFRDVPTTGINAARNIQSDRQLARLQLAASGQGPSIAAMQAQAALEQGRRALNSQAVSDRGNPALARRNAMIQGGSLATRIQQQAMMGRLAEQQQAEAALAQAIHSARAADIADSGIVQNARSNRFNALMGVPSAQESYANQSSQNFAMLGKAWDAYQAKQGAKPAGTLPTYQESGPNASLPAFKDINNPYGY